MESDKDLVRVERISTLVRNRCCTRIFLLSFKIWDAMISGRFGDSGGVHAIGIDEEVVFQLHTIVMRPERLRFNSATQVQVHENFTGTIRSYWCNNQIEDPSGGYTKHGEGTRSKLHVQDLSGDEFQINLWGDLSHQFRSHQLLECKETTIIIVCALFIRIYDGEIHGSSMSASKFSLNLDVPEVAEYSERYEPLNIVPQLLAKN